MLDIQTPIKQTTLDLIAGLNRWQLWSTLAWNEIREKYRRSLIGPFWSTLNFGIFTFSIGALFAALFKTDAQVFIPHFILGMLVWNLLSQVITESCYIFRNMQGYIKEVRIPLTTFIFQLVWRNIILFAYQFVAFILAAIIFKIMPSGAWFFAFIGLLLILANAMWLGIVFAIVAARYHDLIEIIGNILRVMFFITPVLWLPGTIDRVSSLILTANPFYHLIEIFRANLLGNQVGLLSWVIVLFITIAGWILAIQLYHRYKDRVVFWI